MCILGHIPKYKYSLFPSLYVSLGLVLPLLRLGFTLTLTLSEGTQSAREERETESRKFSGSVGGGLSRRKISEAGCDVRELTTSTSTTTSTPVGGGPAHGRERGEAEAT